MKRKVAFILLITLGAKSSSKYRARGSCSVGACAATKAPGLYTPWRLGQPSAPPAKPSEMTYCSCIPLSYRCLTPQAVSYLRTWFLFLRHTL